MTALAQPVSPLETLPRSEARRETLLPPPLEEAVFADIAVENFGEETGGLETLGQAENAPEGAFPPVQVFTVTEMPPPLELEKELHPPPNGWRPGGLRGPSLSAVVTSYDVTTGVTSLRAELSNGQVWDLWNHQHVVDQLRSLTAEPINQATMTTMNAIIWNAWNSAYVVNSGATTGSNPTPSFLLASTGSTAATYTWTAWNVAHEELQTLRQYGQNLKAPTEAELRAALLREKEYREAAEKRAKAAEDAKKRAEQLLLTCLSPEQREDLAKKGCFYVKIPIGGGKFERYRIDRGTHGNVKQLDERGSIIRSFCVQPDGVPVADSMLTQKLFLEADDQTRAKFWETANITDLEPTKKIPAHIPRPERRKYALEHGLLH